MECRNRKPVQLERKGGKGPRQRVWDAIRTMREGIKVAELSRAAKVFEDTVISYVEGLENAGILLAKRENRLVEYRLVKDFGSQAPRVKPNGEIVTQGSANESMWIGMRFLGEFNAQELAGYVRQAGVEVKDDSAKQYIKSLFHAGYLNQVSAEVRGKVPKQARYRLVPAKYTGPRPPMIQRTKSVFDPNLNKVVWTKPIDERVLDEC